MSRASNLLGDNHFGRDDTKIVQYMACDLNSSLEMLFDINMLLGDMLIGIWIAKK